MQAMVEERAEEVRTEEPQVHRETDRQTGRQTDRQTDDLLDRWRQIHMQAGSAIGLRNSLKRS